MRKEKGRGRPANSIYSHKDEKTLEYLAIVAVKYGIGSSEFLNCIVEALNQVESECNQLIIRCRKRTKDSGTFLFTFGGKVVAQFPIWTRILRNNQLESYMKTISAELSVKKSVVANPKIKDLKTGMKKVNLKAKVLDIPQPNMIYTRWGTEARISNALIADETGTIRLSLWNKQINQVSQGDLVEVENGKVASFRGERQLRVGKDGKIGVVQRSREA